MLLNNGSTNNLIEGNFIGTDITGGNALSNGIGVDLRDGNNVVGGTSAAARNVIGANNTGISISTSTGNRIQGNFIGTDVTGTIALGLGDGIIRAAAQMAVHGHARHAARQCHFDQEVAAAVWHSRREHLATTSFGAHRHRRLHPAAGNAGWWRILVLQRDRRHDGWQRHFGNGEHGVFRDQQRVCAIIDPETLSDGHQRSKFWQRRRWRIVVDSINNTIGGCTEPAISLPATPGRGWRRLFDP